MLFECLIVLGYDSPSLIDFVTSAIQSFFALKINLFVSKDNSSLTYLFILLTSIFFSITSLVLDLFFFIASFSLLSCCLSSYTLFFKVSTFVSIFFRSFFSFKTENSGPFWLFYCSVINYIKLSKFCLYFILSNSNYHKLSSSIIHQNISLMTGKINFKMPLSDTNSAFAFLQSIEYWKYWAR